ncbi:MAG: GNAT family N-acetyltransferase [Bacteroidales bacterium]|nr:GNAT family N-acetyltransferase [Bacteroidales bacterium]
MSETTIRKALLKDLKTIADFQKAMAMETENLELNIDILSAGVEKVILNPQMGCYYLAEIKGRICGCMLTLYEWSDWRNAQVIWIHSVYVMPKYRQNGVFKALYMFIKNVVLSDSSLAGLRLFVDKRNVTAQTVYKKIGMTNEHYELFEWLK